MNFIFKFDKARKAAKLRKRSKNINNYRNCQANIEVKVMLEEERIQKNLKELELTFSNEGNDSLNYSTSENEDRLRQLRKNLFELLLKCDQCMSI